MAVRLEGAPLEPEGCCLAVRPEVAPLELEGYYLAVRLEGAPLKLEGCYLAVRPKGAPLELEPPALSFFGFSVRLAVCSYRTVSRLIAAVDWEIIRF